MIGSVLVLFAVLVIAACAYAQHELEAMKKRPALSEPDHVGFGSREMELETWNRGLRRVGPLRKWTADGVHHTRQRLGGRLE